MTSPASGPRRTWYPGQQAFARCLELRRIGPRKDRHPMLPLFLAHASPSVLYRQVGARLRYGQPNTPRGSSTSDDHSMTEARPPSPSGARSPKRCSSEIGAEGLQPGAKLPTEAQLAARFDVNRHTSAAPSTRSSAPAWSGSSRAAARSSPRTCSTTPSRPHAVLRVDPQAKPRAFRPGLQRPGSAGHTARWRPGSASSRGPRSRSTNGSAWRTACRSGSRAITLPPPACPESSPP